MHIISDVQKAQWKHQKS